MGVNIQWCFLWESWFPRMTPRESNSPSGNSNWQWHSNCLEMWYEFICAGEHEDIVIKQMVCGSCMHNDMVCIQCKVHTREFWFRTNHISYQCCCCHRHCDFTDVTFICADVYRLCCQILKFFVKLKQETKDYLLMKHVICSTFM